MDMTEVEAAITSTGVSMEVVGLGLIGLAAAAMGFRWLKAMFF